MLTRDLHTQILPYLHLHDKVYQALQLMNESHVIAFAHCGRREIWTV
jgi:hypothetical protein